MNVLSIFLIIVILACLFSPTKQTESFTSCRTLRCGNNKYSLSSMKNKATSKFKNATSGHLTTINNHLSNLKEKLL